MIQSKAEAGKGKPQVTDGDGAWGWRRRRRWRWPGPPGTGNRVEAEDSLCSTALQVYSRSGSWAGGADPSDGDGGVLFRC